MEGVQFPSFGRPPINRAIVGDGQSCEMNFEQRIQPDALAGEPMQAQLACDALAQQVAQTAEMGEALRCQSPYGGATGAHRHWVGAEGPTVRKCRPAAGRIEHSHGFSPSTYRAESRRR